MGLSCIVGMIRGWKLENPRSRGPFGIRSKLYRRPERIRRLFARSHVQTQSSNHEKNTVSLICQIRLADWQIGLLLSSETHPIIDFFIFCLETRAIVTGYLPSHLSQWGQAQHKHFHLYIVKARAYTDIYTSIYVYIIRSFGEFVSISRALRIHFNQFFVNKKHSFWSKGIMQLPERWAKVIEHICNLIFSLLSLLPFLRWTPPLQTIFSLFSRYYSFILSLVRNRTLLWKIEILFVTLHLL